MLVPNGPRWFDRRRPENSWPSVVISIGLTMALFATAFVAMQTVNGWSARERSTTFEPPIVVQLTPPTTPAPIVRPQPQPVPRTEPRPATAPPPGAITPPPITTAAPPTGVPTVAVPSAPRPTAPAADTASGGASNAPVIPLGPIAFPKGLPDTAMGARAGAPATRAGVTIESRHANTAAYRDSVLGERMKSIPGLAIDHPATGRELAEMQQSRARAMAMARRNSTAGNRDVHTMSGDGVDGVGAVGGSSATSSRRGLTSGSVGLPLFSSGPSAAQRKKNEEIDAEYQLRLRRFEDRIRLKRDSVRADSLRRAARADSLRRASTPRPPPR